MTADDYLRSVSFELGDLPWSQRQDLLVEIRAHLDEPPADTDLEARLGPPKEYAADLRAAAGLEASGIGFPGALHAFHPFDMKPGERRELELKGAYTHCRYWTAGGSQLITDFPVRYRILWRTATADIPLPEPLAIVIPKGFRCFSRP